VRIVVTAGVTVVVGAAFQYARWRPELEPLRELLRLRIVRCTVGPAASFERAARRAANSQNRLKARDDGTFGKQIAEQPCWILSPKV
jgi:hypothetical protein